MKALKIVGYYVIKYMCLRGDYYSHLSSGGSGDYGLPYTQEDGDE